MLQRTLSLIVQQARRALVVCVHLLRTTASIYGGALGRSADLVAGLIFGERTPERRATSSQSLEDRLDAIASEISSSGSRAQSLIDETEALLSEKARQVEDAKARAVALQIEVDAVQQRLDELGKIRPEAADAIRHVLGEDLDLREKRSGRRDLVLFLMGVVASVLVGLAFELLF